MRPIVKILTGATLILVLALGAACETEDLGGGLQPSCMTFEPAMDPMPGQVVAVWNTEVSTCDRVFIDLVLTGVDDVWSAQFEFTYPSGISQVFRFDASNSFLISDGSNIIFNFQEQPPGSGHVEIGVSRENTGTNKGVTPTADDNLLLQLGFQRLSSDGQGDVVFINGDGGSDDETSISIRTNPSEEPVIDRSIDFFGGELSID